MGAQDEGPKKDDAGVPETRDVEEAVVPLLPPNEPEAASVTVDIGSIRNDTGFKALKKSEVLGRIEIDVQSVRILRLDPDDISDQDLNEHARNLAHMNAAPRKDIPDAARKQKEREKAFIAGITGAELDAIYPDASEEEHFRAYSRRGSAEKGDQGSYTRRMSQGMVFGIEMDGRIVAVQACDKLGETKAGRPVLEFSKASTLEEYKGRKINPHLKQFLAQFLEKQEGQTPIWFGASVNPKHLENFVKKGWHLTEMNDPNVEAVQLAYLHGKDYIDENMIPQGYKAVYMDPLVDKVDWGTRSVETGISDLDRLSEDELKKRVDAEFAKIGSTSKITLKGVKYFLAVASKAEAMLGKRILVVDDSKDVLQNIIPLLTVATNGQSNYILHKGEDIETICATIVEANPEFVLMDYSLYGELTGDQIIQRLLQLRPDIKCIGFSSENRTVEFSKAGAIGSIDKKLDNEEDTLRDITSMIGS